MKEYVSRDEFCHRFKSSETRKGQFSWEALRALYNYLEQYEEDCGSEIEFDMIALCCEFTEYEDLKDLQANYQDIEDMEDLRDHTTVIEIEGSEGFIIQDY